MKKILLVLATAAVMPSVAPATPVPLKMKKLHASQPSEWVLLGTGSMIDAWVTPGLKYPEGDLDYTKYPFEVQVYESTATPGMYRIASPWTSDNFPFKNLNKNTTPHDLIINATNPDFVQIEPQEAGFVHAADVHSSNYSDPFYISTLGDYYLSEGNSIPDIIDYGSNSTKVGNVITIKAVFGKEPTEVGYSWPNFPKACSVITLPGEPTAKWVERGELTFIDGFIYPGYHGNPETRGWKVPFEELEGSDGMYRLENPYLAESCPLKDYNLNTENAWVVIDATDPDIVLIAPQYSGFTGDIKGQPYNFYIGNDAGNLNANELWTVENIKEYLPQRLDKMVEGVITVKSPLFGPNSTSGFGVQWTDANDRPIVFPAKFIFPWAKPQEPEPVDPDEPRVRTFYEGFEGYQEQYGLNWIPENWSEINTPANTPTDEMLSHNVNNSWFAYFSSDMYQEMTPDGEKEMFIHYAYDGDWCKSADQDEWLISPQITLNETEPETLRWLLQSDFHSIYDWLNDFDFNTMTFKVRNIVNTLKIMVSDDEGATWDQLWDLAEDVASKMTDTELWDGSDLVYRPYKVSLADYIGKKVKVAFRYVRTGTNSGNSMILDQVIIDHPTSAAIGAIEDAETTPIEYYNLSGIKISIQDAAPGLYIERRGTTSRKILKR